MRNIGKVSQRWLAEIGITTLKDLRDCGVIQVYKMLKERRPKEVSLNLLWALEGAVQDMDWREISADRKVELKKSLRQPL